MLTKSLCLVASLFLATTSASGAEIPVNLALPDFALGHIGSDSLRYARYETGSVTTELTGGFGFWDAGDLELGPDDDVTPYIASVTNCGNQDNCNPFVATFSVALEGADVSFAGVGNFSGSSTTMLSASYFPEA